MHKNIMSSIIVIMYTENLTKLHFSFIVTKARRQ